MDDFWYIFFVNRKYRANQAVKAIPGIRKTWKGDVLVMKGGGPIDEPFVNVERWDRRSANAAVKNYPGLDEDKGNTTHTEKDGKRGRGEGPRRKAVRASRPRRDSDPCQHRIRRVGAGLYVESIGLDSLDSGESARILEGAIEANMTQYQDPTYTRYYWTKPKWECVVTSEDAWFKPQQITENDGPAFQVLQRSANPMSTTPAKEIDLAPIPDYQPQLFPSLIYLGLKNNTSGISTTLVVNLQLPHRPFASQILRTLWTTSQRVQTISSMWNPSRIFVACSRKLIPIENAEHQLPTTGFRELGHHKNIVGDLEGDIGGAEDNIVPRRGSGGTARADDNSYSAGLVASLSPIHQQPAPSPQSTSVVPTKVSDTESARAHKFLEEASRDLPSLAMCRAIGLAELGTAYKMFANVRLVPAIVTELGGVWPKTGTPKPFLISYKSFPGLYLSTDDLLSYCQAPASSTFANHVNWFHSSVKATELLEISPCAPARLLTRKCFSMESYFTP
ncbi:hypothetical protein C8R44DRAFT_748249 [Mycena epipterygia]|nr:hypothetical protein C8R44DRAFT_748249 [Mycena epipterygia]